MSASDNAARVKVGAARDFVAHVAAARAEGADAVEATLRALVAAVADQLGAEAAAAFVGTAGAWTPVALRGVEAADAGALAPAGDAPIDPGFAGDGRLWHAPVAAPGAATSAVLALRFAQPATVAAAQWELAAGYVRQAGEALALAAAGAPEPEGRRALQLRGLADAALALTAAATIEDVLRIVTEAAQEVIGTHQAVTSRLTHGWSAASTHVLLSDKYARWHDYDAVPEGLGVLEYVIRENRPLRLTADELGAHPDWRGLRDAPDHPPLPDYLAAPLIGRDGTNLGLIQLSDKRDGGAFTPEDEAMLVQLAQSASGAIDTIESLGRERAARAAAEREQRIVEELNRVGQVVAQNLELQDVVQVVTDAATTLTGARFGAFFYNVIRPSGEEYMLYTLSGAPREAFERFPMPRNTAVFGPTFRGEGIVRLDDVTADARYGHSAPYHGMPEGHLPVRSYLAAPVLAADGEVIGGLFFGHEEVGVFDADAERLLAGIAAQAAIAIQNARLFEREQAARAEAEKRARAAVSLAHVADGVVLLDADDRIALVNPAAERILGVGAVGVVGRPADEVLPPVDVVRVERGHATLPVEVEGGERWLSLSRVEFGEGTVVAFRDVTEERRLEELRSEIVATVSHELRTPLAAVYGAARTLQRADLAGDSDLQERLVAVVVQESARLGAIVEEILLASQLDAGGASVRAAFVDVAGVVRDVVALLDAEAVTVDVPPEPVHAQADPERLRQVVGNLVDNAVKYAAGDVAVRVEPRRQEVRIAVADRGPGVPSSERRRIFEKFYRLDPQMAQGISGTGLGLYICRELVERMGGRIGVEETPGGGATFTVDLAAT